MASSCRGFPRALGSALALLALGLVFGPAPAGEASRSVKNAFVARLEAALLVETLNAELLSHESATSTLEHWCAEYGLAAPATVVAERVSGADKPAGDEQIRDLAVPDAGALRYRRVKLRCGSLVLSEADNWYVPSRLTPEMNDLLDHTDTPFGRAVKSLGFRRRTLAVSVLAHLLPENWQTLTPAQAERLGPACIPRRVLDHRAVLTLPDGTPFSEVVETYTANAIALPGVKLERCPD
jgi:chorismate-pyruvate lyase